MDNSALAKYEYLLDLTAIQLIETDGNGADRARRDFSQKPETLFMTIIDLIDELVYMRDSVGKNYKLSEPVRSYLRTGLELLGFIEAAQAVGVDFIKTALLVADITEDWASSKLPLEQYIAVSR